MAFALLLAIALATTSLAGEEPANAMPCEKRPFTVFVHGNRVLADELYLALIDLPCTATADAAQAEAIAHRLQIFLRRAGYELAEVAAEASDGAIHVRVNEGALEKVVFRGQLTLHTLRFKLALSIPHNVFNRPELARQMAELSRDLGIPHPRFELVPTADVQHTGVQLESLGTFRGYVLVTPKAPYELHIFFEEAEWNTGPGLDLRAGYFDGLEIGANYQGQGLLHRDDRYRVAGSGGAGLRQSIRESLLYPAPSRAYAEALWYAPELAERLARPMLSIKGEAIARQRADLALENYNTVSAEAAANIQYRASRWATLGGGGGMQYRYLFGFEPPRGEQLTVRLEESSRLRSFAQLQTDFVFDDGGIRADRRHAFSAEGRHFFAITDPIYGEGRFAYQYVLPLGWHDVWIRARGVWLWGEVLVHNEQPLSGTFLRGVFGDEYIRRAAGASAEFRFSLTRDVYKVSFFVDVATYGQLDRVQGTETLRLGTAVGPGLHALIEGMFQVDAYFAFGLTSERRFDTGLLVLVIKVG